MPSRSDPLFWLPLSPSIRLVFFQNSIGLPLPISPSCPIGLLLSFFSFFRLDLVGFDRACAWLRLVLGVLFGFIAGCWELLGFAKISLVLATRSELGAVSMWA